MKGVRLTVFLVLLALLVFLAGCSCNIQKSQSTVLKEIVRNAPRTVQQSYTVEEPVVKKTCKSITESTEKELRWNDFRILLSDVEWVDKPVVLGQTNWIRRQMSIYNDQDVLRMVYLDKIDYYDGKEVKRSKNPMKLLVNPKSSRTVPLMKNVQYDPKISIGAEFTNNTAEAPDIITSEICNETTDYVSITKYRNVSKGVKPVLMGYKEYTKINLTKAC